ncbi:MAG: ferredoxin family protein [Rickettsiaceae bacterium]|nr:ferredoxin family protein [Rickettsiaceae bacterium]
MAYVVTDPCVKCKYTTCVEVCPVDCFKEDELMLIIDPDECIDCGVCVNECPVNAIHPESDELLKWLSYARKQASKLPYITRIKDALPNADKHKNETNKFEKYIKTKP